MTEDRLMVAQAVLEGKISQEYLTQREVDEMMELVADTVFDKLMDEAVERGCSVFAGFEDDPVH
jgi:hypothetical protein